MKISFKYDNIRKYVKQTLEHYIRNIILLLEDLWAKLKEIQDYFEQKFNEFKEEFKKKLEEMEERYDKKIEEMEKEYGEKLEEFKDKMNLSMWTQFGTNCKYRSWVAPQDTYPRTYYQEYGGDGDCPAYYIKYIRTGIVPALLLVDSNADEEDGAGYGEGQILGTIPNGLTKNIKGIYVAKFGQIGLFTYDLNPPGEVPSCNQASASGTKKCNSSCARKFKVVIPGYYRCTRLNVKCLEEECTIKFFDELKKLM